MSGESFRKERLIGRLCLALAVAGLWAGGCADGPGPVSPGQPAADNRIVAVEPFDMTQNVSTQPTFKWKLPESMAVPTTVTFKLAEAGQADTPTKDATVLDENKVAIVTDLVQVSPTALDLFRPPAGCVVLGDITTMTQLKGMTWYRWTIFATNLKNVGSYSSPNSARADFYFRTRTPDLPDVPAATPAATATSAAK
jgi:hypothetical protein